MHVLLKYGHENAEMQKQKFDDVTLRYSIGREKSNFHLQCHGRLELSVRLLIIMNSRIINCLSSMLILDISA